MLARLSGGLGAPWALVLAATWGCTPAPPARAPLGPCPPSAPAPTAPPDAAAPPVALFPGDSDTPREPPRETSDELLPASPTHPTLASPERPRPVCVVLSVGAEQGLAHIGVLDALRERGIRVDCVIGTSMGALIGGLFASAPERDVASRYRDVFQLYAGKPTPSAGDLWFALSATWATPKAWERMRDVLGRYLGGARIEAARVPFVTVHQRLTETGARSETVREGLFADEIAASIANPLIFPGMTIQRGTQLDPGLDRVSSVPLETACEQFPDHQFVVSNVTPSSVFVSARMSCPYQELRFDGLPVERLRALTAQEPDFGRLVRAGHEKVARELDLSRLPPGKPVEPPLEFVRVFVDIELAPRGTDGGTWDGLGGLPDVRQTTHVSACAGCEQRGTHAGRERTSEGVDSLTLSSELGILALRRGFVLRTTVVDVDVRSDDPVGVVETLFEGGEGERTHRLAHATVKLRFVRP